jgi:prolyl oligopeptidase
MDSVVYRLEVGAPESAAQPVFSAALWPQLGLRRIDNAWMTFHPDSPYVIASSNDTTERNDSLFVLPWRDLGKADAKWVRITDFDGKVVQTALSGESLYLLTYADAPRYRIRRLDLATPDLARAVDVLPEQPGVILSFSLGKGALYADVREPFGIAVLRQPLDGGKPQRLELPIEGVARVYADTLHARDGVFLYGVSWTEAPRVYLWDAASGATRDSGLAAPGELASFPDVAVERVMVPSHDGVKVPLTLLYRKGLKRDGNNPTIVYGYGSYGITIDPGFSTGIYAWLEQGGIYAVASVRGGGELGDEWRMGGTKKNKPNTWKDGIACAEYLVANKYSSPGTLSIMGGSAGGIFAGRAITERPDLFRAGVIQVGATDTLRFETTANGITNVSEMGTTKDPQGFRDLLAMSTYQNIRDGVAYPAVIFVHGINDPRVEVWESLKTGARFQAASTSGRPVVLRLDDKAGHGIGSTVSQRLAETADTYAFLLWQMGVKAYQRAAAGS